MRAIRALREAVAIAANHRAILHHDAGAERASLADGDVRVHHAVGSNHGVGRNHGVGMNDGPGADVRAGADRGKGTD